ncbi:MAG: hypothetical protein WAL25_12660, partial [Acidimicrobiia bacterium]
SHPTSATPTNNFGQPAIAVSFALAKPGESIDDFRTRIAARGDWGQSRVGREKIELVLTEESATQLTELLAASTTELKKQRPKNR